MPENEMDPAASTQMFRAFVDDQATQQSGRATQSGGGGVSPVVIGGIVGAIVVVALVLWLALG